MSILTKPNFILIHSFLDPNETNVIPPKVRRLKLNTKIMTLYLKKSFLIKCEGHEDTNGTILIRKSIPLPENGFKNIEITSEIFLRPNGHVIKQIETYHLTHKDAVENQGRELRATVSRLQRNLRDVYEVYCTCHTKGWTDKITDISKSMGFNLT